MGPVVTLLTDFGDRDGYRAAMKGVIWSAAPEARVTDAAHHIPPQDIRAGAWALGQYWNLFPEGTIHVAVVDPGVGSDRRMLIVRADGRWLIGPDNGLFSWALESAGTVECYVIRPGILRSGEPAPTFQGRDVFACAAGWLASGRRTVAELADPVADILRMPWTRSRRVSDRRVEGEVVHLDHFGNAITNLRAGDWESLAGRTRLLEVKSYYFNRLVRTYSDVEPDRKIALVGSTGHVEIAVRGASAAERLGLRSGDPVTLTGLD